MPIPSRLMGSGINAQAAVNICGDSANALTATGSSATDALQLSAVLNNIGTTASSTGVKLPPTEAGAVIFIRNTGAQTLTIYPPTGSTINGTTSASIATAKGIICFATTGTAWFTVAGA